MNTHKKNRFCLNCKIDLVYSPMNPLALLSGTGFKSIQFICLVLFTHRIAQMSFTNNRDLQTEGSLRTLGTNINILLA